MGLIKIITTVIGVLAPMMYFHGQAFYTGWLEYWGIPVGIYPISLEETLAYGYVTYSVLALPYLIVLLIYLLIAIGTLYNINELSKISWVRKIASYMTVKKTDKTDKGHPFVAVLLGNTAKVSLILLLVFLFLLLVILVSEKANDLGVEAAQNKHKALSDNKKITIISFRENRMEGHVIVCSNAFCTLLSDDRLVLVSLADDFKLEWELPDTHI